MTNGLTIPCLLAQTIPNSFSWFKTLNITFCMLVLVLACFGLILFWSYLVLVLLRLVSVKIHCYSALERREVTSVRVGKTTCVVVSARHGVFAKESSTSCKDHWPTYCKIINDSCTTSHLWMRKYCPVTCGLCGQNKQVNPCENHKCLYYSRCTITGHRAKCRCKKIFDCPKLHSFVCGTDRVTYRNICILRAIACQLRKNIEVQSVGFCKFPCAHVKCRNFAECQVSSEGESKCVCPSNKPCLRFPIPRPICAMDGVTYYNECFWKAKSCKENRRIPIARRGRCEFPCAHVKCRNFAKCKVTSDGVGMCMCPTYEQCSRIPRPICGKNGVTFYNECFWRVKSCKESTWTPIEKRGRCAVQLEAVRATVESKKLSCRTSFCPYYTLCQEVNGLATCVKICPESSCSCAHDVEYYQHPNGCLLCRCKAPSPISARN